MNITEDNKEAINDIPITRNRTRKVKRIENNFIKHFVICFVLVLFAAIFVYKTEIKNFIASFNQASTKGEKKWEFTLPFTSRRQNILLMGVDVSSNANDPFDHARSDSIYLISIAPHAKNINIISIPRDSKVYIHSHSNPDKINHAFAYGGIETSKKTIEQTLGVRIDHYLVVSNKALVEFIDKIGGLDVYVEKNMHYNDNTAGLHINLEKGVQHLNGAEAEGYLRYRKDALGDIGRIRRQQWFLNALAEKMKDPAIIVKIPDIVKSISKNIQTDFSFYELAQYAALAKTVDSSQIKVATLPGEPSQRGFISYWILDPDGVQDIVNKLVYGEKPKTLNRPVEAGILYVPSEEQKALELQKELEANGINVNLRQVRILGHDHIAIHNFDLPNETLNGLKHTIYFLKDKQTVYDAIGINKAARDFTVVLAGSSK